MFYSEKQKYKCGFDVKQWKGVKKAPEIPNLHVCLFEIMRHNNHMLLHEQNSCGGEDVLYLHRWSNICIQAWRLRSCLHLSAEQRCWQDSARHCSAHSPKGLPPRLPSQIIPHFPLCANQGCDVAVEVCSIEIGVHICVRARARVLLPPCLQNYVL